MDTIVLSSKERSTEVTDESHTGIPTCRSVGTEVTVVNFGDMTFTGEARVVLVANRKGGVGKSSLVAAAANAVASGGRGGGHRVLVIDGDPQGTITKSDLGARDNDGGESLGMSLLYGRHDLEPLIEVKPNLDIVAGGSKLAKRHRWSWCDDILGAGHELPDRAREALHGKGI